MPLTSTMPYRELTGNIFASKAQALVNTVNCVGPMGKGIALEFRRRFPEMYETYKAVCDKGALAPGDLLPYRDSKPWVLNLAVKNDWKHPSKIEWVEQCLQNFCKWYPSVALKSVAFPWMGAMNGRIPLDEIKDVTRHFLENLDDIEVEVYSFDPYAPDPLFDTLQGLVTGHSREDFRHKIGLQKKKADWVYVMIEAQQARSLSEITASGELGKASLDRLYASLVAAGDAQKNPEQGSPDSNPEQMDLL